MFALSANKFAVSAQKGKNHPVNYHHASNLLLCALSLVVAFSASRAKETKRGATARKFKRPPFIVFHRRRRLASTCSKRVKFRLHAYFPFYSSELTTRFNIFFLHI
jgi:hypothetical protein